ncbi:trigger factor [Planctomycetales bacterium]|nr:trigger factor [Planctomycetales bacterium]
MSEQEEKTAIDLTTEISTVSSCERRIKVTIPREEIDRYFENEYAEIEKEAHVPGFRAGKAPRKLVESRFKKDTAERVKQTLVIDALTKVNDGQEFTAISEPDFDYSSLVLSDAGPFVFEFTIEVRPEFDVPNWKGLKIEKPVREFSAADVDTAVKRVLNNYGSLEKKDDFVEAGDYIETAITFKDGDTVLSSAERETLCVKAVLTLHDTTIKDFDKLFNGAKKGDTISTKVVISENAANTEYKGKTIEAVFEILEVKKMVLPQLTNEFLERIGNFEDEGTFRDAVLDSLKRQLEHERHRRARKQITDLLTVAATWELPPGLLKRQSERELRRIVMELQRSGYAQEEIDAQLNFIRQNNEASTAQSLKEHFILEKIAEVENVQDLPEDYDTEIALIAAQSGQSPRRVRAQIEKSGESDILRNQIIERKVLNLINENAQFVEVPFVWEKPEEEALDWAAAGDPEAIAEVEAEDLKAVNQEIDRKRKFDPNAKVK